MVMAWPLTVKVPAVGASARLALASWVVALRSAGLPITALLATEVEVARCSTLTENGPVRALALALAVATLGELLVAVLPMIELDSSSVETELWKLATL